MICRFLALIYLIFTIRRERDSKYVYVANECQISGRDTGVNRYYTSALLKNLHRHRMEQGKTKYVVQKKFVMALMYHA